MARIRGRDTKPELAMRKALHARGLRYRLHYKGLPGRPDLVFPKFQAVVFVHGCFWHRHEGCRFTTTPATRPEFWAQKFEQNVLRDHRAIANLEQSGWRTAIVWECAIKEYGGEQISDRISQWLAEDHGSLVVPDSHPEPKARP
ncbi:very short patch repair endonuclease [Sphingopyxis sp. 113P3]|uniref:very short patch repair endonuclease n=1 Tax=Sphingopyxis sp. (strain 113P3) TaxID=292913 RepID=UPI001F1FB861|nr:very short patch repair endonuclease [Sphingopyxis sp. 113P3]